jgi:tRNA modification GTPase
MKDQTDTICALSTPPGNSGLAVVRVSGLRCFDIYRQIFKSKKGSDTLPERVALLGRIVDPRDGSEVDEALAICFTSAHSYTGEDMVEYSLHGSPVLIAALLDGICYLGARIAEPGEFTMRAFLNGRMDLTQAEAVRDIIEATTRRQAQEAAKQRSGAIARQMQPVKARLIDIIANLEAAVEFVEEELALDSREIVSIQIQSLQCELGKWIDSYRQGRIVREGISIAIVGRPNVGKSSVFNALLAQDRSIVAEMPGTTRDLVSEYASMDGIAVRLMDTAGIRNSNDSIEQNGIDRSHQAIADSDAILLVVDTSLPKSDEDMDLRSELSENKCIAVMNKTDLDSRWTRDEKEEFAAEWPWVAVSAKTGAGIELLRSAILEEIMGSAESGHEGMTVTNLRHCRCLENAKKDMEHAIDAFRGGLSEEFGLSDLHRGLKALGEITGETLVEDLLDQIFTKFCIGK